MKAIPGLEFLFRPAALLLPLLPGLTACVHVKTDPIRIEPIYIEVTINHRVQRELDNLFADIDRASQTADYVPLDEANPETEK